MALKSFYLGRGIADSKQKSQAIDKIKNAISILSGLDNIESKKRKLFYMLLLSEILRDNNESITIRGDALQLSKDFSLSAYGYYMQIVSATSTKKQVNDIANFARNTSITNHRIGGSSWDEKYHDNAMFSLGISSDDLTDKNFKFLFNTSMKEIMESHQLW